MSFCSPLMHALHDISITDNSIATKCKILYLERKVKIQLAVERILHKETVYFHSGSGSTVFPFSQEIIEEVVEILRNVNDNIVIQDKDGSRFQAKGLLQGKTISLLK